MFATKCSKTWKLREQLRSTKWFTVHKEVDYLKINCTNALGLRNIGSYLYNVKFIRDSRVKNLKLGSGLSSGMAMSPYDEGSTYL
jgi:hypothetical protein